MAVRYMSRFLVQTAPSGMTLDGAAPAVPAPALPSRVVAALPNALRVVPVRTGFHLMADDPTVDDCKRQVLEILRPMQDSTTKWSVELASQAHIEIAGAWVKIGPGQQAMLFTIGITTDGAFKPFAMPAGGLGQDVQQTYHILFQPE